MVYSVSAMKIACPTVETTQNLAQQLATQATAGDALLLSGELGAGKTTFVQALLGALGVTEPVTSPTYAIAYTYQTPQLDILHIDAYRLTDMEACISLDLPAYSRNHLILMEWPPTGIESLLPGSQILALSFEYAPTGRHITFTPHGSWVSRLPELNLSNTA